MTPQEIFNKAVAGLASQKFQRSVSDNGRCLYRGPNGLKCAIGHVVTDEQIAEVVKQIRVYNKDCNENAEGFNGRVFSKTLSASEHFLDNLQSAHDISHNPVGMIHSLRWFAKENELELPEILKDA